MKGTRQPGKKPTTREGRKKLPECGAITRDGTPCKKPAGHGTSHPGEGKCRLHGGVGQIRGTRYEQLSTTPRLGELIDQFAADTDPLNLSHELHLLRALVSDYVERYDETTAALLAWHASFSSGFLKELGAWRVKFAKWAEGAEQQRREPDEPPPIPPQPEEFAEKPRQMVDITAAAGLINQIGAMADRIEKRQQNGVITMARVAQIMDELAMELVNACEEVGIRDDDRTRLLTVVDRRWRDARTIPRDAFVAEQRVSSGAGTLN